MSGRLGDQSHRDQALDPGGSFIVQAPAGSGKTELLTLRYLNLLAISEQPEEVLAITFTRKAASEMKQRIIETLHWALAERAQSSPPTEAYKRLRLDIAGRVLDRDRSQDWKLLSNTGRLRVQTIDSFCAFLASSLPIHARTGADPATSEDVDDCFREAIAQTLQLLESEGPVADDLQALLEHLDNDVERLQGLLQALLPKRDQWLPYVLELGAEPEQARRYLEAGLEELVAETLSSLRERLQPWAPTLLELFNYSFANRDLGVAPDSGTEMIALPANRADDVGQWHLLVELLLTNANGWRKRLTKGEGFPPAGTGSAAEKALAKQRKQEMLDLLSDMQAADASGELLATLCQARLLPRSTLPESQWQFLASLLRVLTTLSSQLLLAFRKFGKVDYPQASAAALQALGQADSPSDLALALDHRLQHILVDEFQDTSRMQLDLLARLTAGWSPDDGRSLFVVGDAMQSCYGFRNANVGIYLEVRDKGLGGLPLTPLQLTANFRSRPPVIDWVNSVFGGAFPASPDIGRGAVPYSASEATRDNGPGAGVRVEIISHDGEQRAEARAWEARQLFDRLCQIRAQHPGESVAILARTRSHLAPLVSLLRDSGIPWQATDVDSMNSLMVIEDLLSLTAALANPADELAWLALLRAPWCGLDSGELLAVTRLAGARSLPTLLGDAQALGRLEFEAQSLQRLLDSASILSAALQRRGRGPLRQLVETTWTLLRGPECCRTSQERDGSKHYFSLLEEQERAGGLLDLARFRDHVLGAKLPSPPLDPDQDMVHLLTMHKAKGLEFDHVLIPSLSLAPRTDSKSLLQWHERLNRAGDSRLLLAALTAAGEDDDPLYQLLRFEKKQKDLLESTRLLYIAVTRAKHSATLYATLQEKDGDLKPPPAQSLLARIYTQLESQPTLWQCTPLPAQAETAILDSDTDTGPTPIRILVDGPQLEESTRTALRQTAESAQPDEADAEQADPLAAATGTLIHRALEHYVRDPALLLERRNSLRPYWRRQLSILGLDGQRMEEMLEQIEDTLQRCLDDSANRWIFDRELEDSACELSLSRFAEAGWREFQIDRSFIDKEGRRWIIDYKTATPGPHQDREQFVAEQLERHRQQLQGYGQLFAAMERRPQRLALYFTGLSRLAELNDQ